MSEAEANSTTLKIDDDVNSAPLDPRTIARSVSFAQHAGYVHRLTLTLRCDSACAHLWEGKWLALT